MLDLIKQKITYKHLISMLVVIGGLIWLSVFSFPDNKLHLVFCDVGQGDAILITKGFDQMLIDGGPNDKVLQCLANNMPFFDKTIEVVALTHPEADHLTGLLSVLDKYQVETFLTGPEGNNSAIYAELISKLKMQNSKFKHKTQNYSIQILNTYTGETIKIGDISLETLWPEKEWVAERLEVEKEKLGEENVISSLARPPLVARGGLANDKAVLGAKTKHAKLNDFSLVFLLRYKNFEALLMGDADSVVDDEIALANSLEKVDVLKFPHHGSKTGMKEDFLQQISPRQAVISVGRNSYGHPTSEALELLQKYGVKIRRTDLEGEIHYQF